MKIVFVLDSWNEGNGAITATKRVVSDLIKKGHEITIVATGQHEGDYKFCEIPGFILPPLREGMESMNFLFGIGKKKILREAYKGADLIQIQFPFLLARNAVKIAKQMGIPVIGGCHVQPQNVVAASGKESKLMEKVVTWLFNKTLFKQVDIIQCPSQFAADLLTKLGSKAYMEIISNGIIDDYVPKKYARPDWIGDKFTLIYIGRQAKEKRQELLIQGVAKSKYKDKIQLLLCGKGEDSEKLKELGKRLPVKPFIEYVSNEDKVKYLNIADMYVHPSVVELESLSCLEAIGCGTPCLISNSPSSAAPQFALNNTFLFDVDDADSLAEKIDYHFEHREALNARTQEVIEMSKRYRFDKCMSELVELYENTLEFYKNRRKIPMLQIVRQQDS